MTRRASDTLGPDGFDVDAARRRAEEQQAATQAAAARMTREAREAIQQRRDETAPLRSVEDL